MYSEGFWRSQLPNRRDWNQIWIYHQLEPPFHFSPKEHLNGLFNWTMTYRRDSDVYLPYSRVVVKDFVEDEISFNGISLDEWIKGKSALGTAVISRSCNAASQRLEILEKLIEEGLNVDIYGKCGNNTGICRRETPNCYGKFWDTLASQYKFFFAFENSICTDYVTEKLWRSLEIGMVPVVLGGATYSEIAPPNSFIDIRDFPNPKDLKDHLLMLDRNPKEYAKYFEWRKQYSINLYGSEVGKLCDKLKDYRSMHYQFVGHQMYSKYYPNLTGWWATRPGGLQPVCISPFEMGLSRYLNEDNKKVPRYHYPPYG